jgi:hypothetical protein
VEPSLDSLIAASAPPIARRTPNLERDLHAVVSDAEFCSAPVRRGLRFRIAISGLAAVGLIGVTAGASVAGVLPTPEWAPWYEKPAATHAQTVTSGAVCEVAYAIKAHNKQTMDPAVHTAAVAAAEDFLRRFDFSTINIAEAVRDVPSTAVLPEDPPEARETFAVQYYLAERVREHLIDQGLPPAAVSVSAAQTCTDGGS